MEPLRMFLDHLIWWVAGAAVVVYLLLTPVIRSRRRLRSTDEPPPSPTGDVRAAGAAPVVSAEEDVESSAPGSDDGGLTLSEGTKDVDEAAGSRVESHPTALESGPADDAAMLELSLDDSSPIVDATPDAERRTDDVDEGLSLDLEEDSSPEPSVSAGTGQGRSTYPASGAVSYRGTAEDNETRLEMAKAYVDLGDAQGASALLDLVEVEGSSEERSAAARLRESLGGDRSSNTTDGGAFDADSEEPPETDLERVLDLALAYIEIGENESAKLLIDRVLRDGNEAQRRQAEELGARIA